LIFFYSLKELNIRFNLTILNLLENTVTIQGAVAELVYLQIIPNH